MADDFKSIRFDSWGACIARAAEREALDLAGERSPSGHGSSLDRRNRQFNSTDTLGEAIGLARHGWPEGTARIVRGLESLAATEDGRNQTAPSWGYDVAGEFPDVGAYCAGVPEYMITSEAHDMHGNIPVARVFVDHCPHCGITPREIENYGVAILSYLSALQAAGYGVELVLYGTLWVHDERRWQWSVSICDPSSPLDIDRAAYALANADFFRRVVFATWEMEPEWLPVLRDSYGYSTEDECRDDRPGQTLVVPTLRQIRGEAQMSPEAVIEHLQPFFAPLLEPED